MKSVYDKSYLTVVYHDGSCANCSVITDYRWYSNELFNISSFFLSTCLHVLPSYKVLYENYVIPSVHTCVKTMYRWRNRKISCPSLRWRRNFQWVVPKRKSYSGYLKEAEEPNATAIERPTLEMELRGPWRFLHMSGWVKEWTIARWMGEWKVNTVSDVSGCVQSESEKC